MSPDLVLAHSIQEEHFRMTPLQAHHAHETPIVKQVYGVRVHALSSPLYSRIPPRIRESRQLQWQPLQVLQTVGVSSELRARS